MFLLNWHINCYSLAHDRYYMTWITKLFSNKSGYFILLSTGIEVATTNKEEFAWEMKPMCHPGSRMF